MKVSQLEGMGVIGIGFYPVHGEDGTFEVLLALANGMEITFFADGEVMEMVKRDVSNLDLDDGDEE